MAQSKTEIETRNKALVQAGFDAWNAGTGSPFELLADDASWTIVGNSDAANTYPSKEAFLQEVIRPFNARMKEGIKPSDPQPPRRRRGCDHLLRRRRHGARRQALHQHLCVVLRHARRQGDPGATPSSTACPSTTCGGACSRERAYCGRGPT